jgi:hypothetical protein
VFLLVAGGVVGAFSYLSGIVPLLALGLGILLLGVMVLFLPESASFRADRLASLSSFPSIMNDEALIEDLDVTANGIYIPVSGFGAVPKVYVPMLDSDAAPYPPTRLANSNRLFVVVGMNLRDRGILLNAPGAEILIAIENALQLDLSTLDPGILAARLEAGLDMLGISKSTSLQIAGDTVTVEMNLLAFTELEEKVRSHARRVAAQVGTPLTSAIASVVCKVRKKYVRLSGSSLQGSKLRIRLTVLGVELK